MECKYCEKVLSGLSNLHTHLKISRECRSLRKKVVLFGCEKCSAVFVSAKRLEIHGSRCTLGIRDDIEDEYVFVFY
jgi:hypothetical protein